jgi:hypothetical protein
MTTPMLARAALFAAVFVFGVLYFTPEFMIACAPIFAFLGVAVVLPVLLTPPDPS